MIRRISLFFFVGLWIAAVCFGVGRLWSYNHAAGAAATAPERWPATSLVSRDTSRHTLVMMAHPKCPCTRASIEELSKLMATCEGRLSAYVLFIAPKNSSEDWYRTDLWNSAARIPGVVPLIDDAGSEASRFGALTSGQVVLYDGRGQLLFSGGITQSRGHAGDNAGRSAIASLVNRGTAGANQNVVFGCPLFDPDSARPKTTSCESH